MGTAMHTIRKDQRGIGRWFARLCSAPNPELGSDEECESTEAFTRSMSAGFTRSMSAGAAVSISHHSVKEDDLYLGEWHEQRDVEGKELWIHDRTKQIVHVRPGDKTVCPWQVGEKVDGVPIWTHKHSREVAWHRPPGAPMQKKNTIAHWGLDKLSDRNDAAEKKIVE